VIASLALFGIVALPILCGVAVRGMSRIAELRPNLAWLAGATALLGALIGLASAWAWWGLNPDFGDAVVGGWTRVSFTGTPLTVGFGAAACSVVIALTAARATHLLDPNSSALVQAISSHGLFVVGAALAVLGDTSPTLLIGLGCMDIAGVWYGVRSSSRRVAVRVFGTQVIAVFLAGFLLMLQNSSDNAYRLATPASQTANLLTLLISIAIILHANLLPLGVASEATSSLQTSAGFIGAMTLFSHTGPAAVWVPALAAVTCIFWSVRALGAVDAQGRAARISMASAAFFVAFGSYSPAAAASGWLLGTALLFTSGVARIVGAYALLALPATPAFIALTAAPPATTDNPLFLAMAALHAGCHAVFLFALLRHILGAGDLSTLRSAFANSRHPKEWPAIGLAVLHLSALGIAPQLFGGPSLVDSIARTGASTWIAVGVGTLLGTALWRLGSEALSAPLAQADMLLVRVGASFHPIYSALDRLRRGGGMLLSLLDSDGALLLAFLALVLVVLISGQATP
jgi:hypothetical protein